MREMKELLQDELTELDDSALNGIVGALSAYTQLDLEEVAKMDLTFDEYANISPAIKDIEVLVINKALGAYTRNLCTLMYRLGQRHATVQAA